MPDAGRPPAGRGQADVDLISVASITARAHHHAAGMVCDGELIKALEKALEQEKGCVKEQNPRTANPAKTPTTNVGGYDRSRQGGVGR